MLDRKALVRCIKCQADNVADVSDGIPRIVQDVTCVACRATFGHKDLPRNCSKCERNIYSNDERGVGLCSACELASWTPEKRVAVGRLVSMAFRDPKPTEEETSQAIDEVFKHIEEGQS